MIKISFIVIGYNIEKYVERCIRSLVNQTMKEIEVVFVDDGSTDNTVKIVEELAKNDTRIRIVYQKNSGANEARKAGIKVAKGDYVSFVDGDDWVDLDMAKRIYNVLQGGNYDIVTFNYTISYDDESKNSICSDTIYENISGYGYLELILNQKIAHCLWNKVYSKSFLLNANFYGVCGTSMGEDLAANVLLGVSKPKVKMIKDNYYFYYQRATSTMNNPTKTLLEIVDSLEYINKVLKQYNLYYKYKQEIDFLWFIQCYKFNIITSDVKHNKYHKQLFEIWKSYNVDIYNNELCMKLISKSRSFKIIDFSYNINYYLGDLVRRIYKLLLKIISCYK